jgi:hypothetical protein
MSANRQRLFQRFNSPGLRRKELLALRSGGSLLLALPSSKNHLRISAEHLLAMMGVISRDESLGNRTNNLRVCVVCNALLCHPKRPIVRVLAKLSNHPLTIARKIFFLALRAAKICREFSRALCRFARKFFFSTSGAVENVFEQILRQYFSAFLARRSCNR